MYNKVLTHRFKYSAYWRIYSLIIKVLIEEIIQQENFIMKYMKNHTSIFDIDFGHVINNILPYAYIYGKK